MSVFSINYASICIFYAYNLGYILVRLYKPNLCTHTMCLCQCVCPGVGVCMFGCACVSVRVLNKKRHFEAASCIYNSSMGPQTRAECFGSPHTCYRPNDKAVNQYFSPLKPGQPSGDLGPKDPKKECSMFQKIETERLTDSRQTDMQTARKADRQADRQTGKTDRQDSYTNSNSVEISYSNILPSSALISHSS